MLLIISNSDVSIFLEIRVNTPLTTVFQIKYLSAVGRGDNTSSYESCVFTVRDFWFVFVTL